MSRRRVQIPSPGQRLQLSSKIKVLVIAQESLEAKLRVIGTRIREIIEITPHDKRPERLMDFPHGACGDSSMIMGTYLIKNGFVNVEYVVGIDGEQSHAWLECDGVIVDITADQFGSEIDRVIVTKDKSWHNHFAAQERNCCDFREYQDPTIYELYDFSEAMGLVMDQGHGHSKG